MPQCLGDFQLNDPMDKTMLAAPSFLWACPACFKKGLGAAQRTALKPVAQRPAGAKKPRKNNKRKK